MLASYVESVRAGFLAFVGVGALVLLPLIALHYHRFGRVEPRRAFVLYGLLAYGLVALALIFLPFPDPGEVCRGEQMLSTTPFQWVTDMRNNMVAYGRSGLVAMVTSTAFLQQAFNVALFVPLGVVLRRSYGRGPLAIAVIGLGLSLAVEVVQYTGNLGVYPCPYRIADVDDLISNTSGALLGWLLAPMAFVVPAVPGADESSAPPHTVTVPRRVVGTVVDLMAVLVVARLVDGVPWVLGAVVLLRVVLPAVIGGRTLGGWLLRYRHVRADGTRAHLGRLALRESLGLTGLLAYAALLSPDSGEPWGLWLDLLVVAAVFLGTLVVPAFRRDQRGWHEQAAGTRAADTAGSRFPAGEPAAESSNRRD